MDEIIGFSVRGTTYYFQNTLSAEQFTNVQRLAKQFYASDLMFKDVSDDVVIESFVSSARINLGISLSKVTVVAVVVIK